MSSVVLTLVSVAVYAMLAVVCAAVMLLALWQGVAHRRNQRLALAMFVYACFGGASVLFRFQDVLNISPAFVIYLANSCYAIGTIALLDYTLEYTGVSARLRRGMRFLGLLLSAVILPVMWAGFAFTDIVKNESNAVNYNVTPMGIFSITVVVIFEIAAVIFIRRTKARHSQTLWATLALLPIEVFVGTFSPLQGLPTDGMAMLVVVLVVAQVVIRDQIREPNLILNVQLARANIELTRANKRKSEFLAVISHELRTPLSAIISYTDMLRLNMYGPLNERLIDRLGKIGESGQQLLSVIGNVLDLSKLEAGQLRLNTTPVLLYEKIPAVIRAVLPPDDGHHGITVICDVAPGLPLVCADAVQLEKILRNLLTNALANMQFGTLSVGAQQQGNQHVEITISHTGAGFSAQELAHLFDPTHTNLPDESTRLELAIAAQLVRLHGGTLQAESEGISGRGAVFRFALPIYQTAGAVDSIAQPAQEAAR